MATIKDNIVTEGLSGMIGNVIVFRQVRGKTIVASRPRKPRFQSELQRKNRVRFAEASAFARLAMHDPEKKQYYQAKARKLKLPNAYTAALTDYLRKPEVTAIKYKGNNQQNISITAGKAGFSLASVTVTMVNAEGTPLVTDRAVLKDRQKNEWAARFAPDVMQLLVKNTNNGDTKLLVKNTNNGGTNKGGTNKGSSCHSDCATRLIVTATDHTGNAVSHMLAA